MPSSFSGLSGFDVMVLFMITLAKETLKLVCSIQLFISEA